MELDMLADDCLLYILSYLNFPDLTRFLGACCHLKKQQK